MFLSYNVAKYMIDMYNNFFNAQIYKHAVKMM